MARIPAKIFSILFGVVGGWASALYFIDSVGSKPAGIAGNWRMWDLAAGTSSNPYARAHFLIEGRVPPAQSLFQVYTNSRDDDGSKLSSACVYRISVGALESRWWSLSVGPLDSPEKDASAVATSDEVVRGPGGSIEVAISRHPVAGNWIRPAMEGNIVLQLVVSNAGGPQAAGILPLPKLQLVGC